MSSSVLHNPQQSLQKPVPHTVDAIGRGSVINSQLGTGTGKVLNGITEMKSVGKRSKKK